jgi:hypothetical protein
MRNGLQIGVEDIKKIVWQEIWKRHKFEKTPFHSSLCVNQQNRFQFESVQMSTYETWNYCTLNWFQWTIVIGINFEIFILTKKKLLRIPSQKNLKLNLNISENSTPN